jgi:hypothetical protein
MGLSNKSIWVLFNEGKNIYAGSNGKGLFVSSDNCGTWNPLNSHPINYSVIISIAVRGNMIFAGTIGGLFVSTDYGKAWIQRNEGIKNDFITSLSIKGDYIYAGTNGSGVYRAKLSDFGILDVEEKPPAKLEFTVYSSPFDNNYTASFKVNEPTQIKLELYDYMGRCLGTCAEGYYDAGRHDVRININRFQSGVYFVKFQSDKRTNYTKLVFNN